MDIGNILKLVRTRKNLTQQEMAERLGISQNYLSLIESNKKTPGNDILSEFAKTLKISKDALIFAAAKVPEELNNDDAKEFQKLQNNILSLLLFELNGDSKK